MPVLQPAVIAVSLAVLLWLGYLVLRPFLALIAWSVILAYVTWPLYIRLKGLLRCHATWSALAMTLLLTAAMLVPLFWLAAQLQAEIATVYHKLTSYVQRGPHPLPEFLVRIPWLGVWLQALLDRVSGDMTALETEVMSWLEYFRKELAEIALGLGRFSTQLVLVLVTLFFLYRDGERFLALAARAAYSILGNRVKIYLTPVGATTKAVMYSIVFVALAQGGMAGLGYGAAGLQSPLLLATFTTIISLLPIPATPIVWSSIGLWLILTDRIAAGIGLLLWGALVVNWVDNLVRPLVISSTAHIPFLLVMFGVLGGIAAFGVVGLFLGPVILAVILALLQGWLEDQAMRECAHPTGSSGP